MTLKNYFGDIARTPILAITLFAVSAIALFLDAPLIIPTFAASLFTLIILQHGHSVRVVIFSHMIAFILAATAPLFFTFFEFIPQAILQPAVFALIVFVASLVFTITKLEHAPAIASTIVFFEAGSEGVLLFNLMPVNIIVAFAAGLIIVAITARFVSKIDKKMFANY